MSVKNFYYSFPTVYYFGEHALDNLAKELSGACRVLVAIGKKSAKDLGIVAALSRIFSEQGITAQFVDNLLPNPSLESAQELANKINAMHADLVLAVGGGSVIDTAKAAIWLLKDKYPTCLGTVLTVPSSGSEVNRSFVVYDEKSQTKLARADQFVVPKFAIADPSYTRTLSREQIACCLADIMAHLLEQFFCKEERVLWDRLIISSIQTAEEIRQALEQNFQNADARAELVLLSSFALSYLLSCGSTMDWVAHGIEHAISGKYKTNHGAGMSVLMPAWVRYAHTNSVYASKLAKLGEAVGQGGAQGGLLFIETFYHRLNLKDQISPIIRLHMEELISVLMSGGSLGRVQILDETACRIFLQQF